MLHPRTMPAESGDPPGEVDRAARAVLIDGTALLVLLPAGSGAPLAGRMIDGAAWQAVEWDGGGVGIVASGAITPGCLQGGVVRAGTAGDGAAWALPRLGEIAVEAEPLVRHLRATQGDALAVLNLLLTALPTPTPRQAVFLRAFLETAASADGFIEIVATPEGRGVLLQGWGQGLGTGTVRVAVVADQLRFVDVVMAEFDRPDLLAPAKGFVGFAKDLERELARGIRFACVTAGPQLLRMDVVPNGRVLIEGAAATAHLAAMLPRLSGEARALRALRRVCRPRFAGVDTLDGWDLPVRAAVDLLLGAGPAGVLATGWLLDPEARVRLALLKSRGGFYARLEQRWVRLPRPDLNDGFAAHPQFAGRLRLEDVTHGFICFAPAERPMQPDDVYYLELVLEDERCAFLPLAPPVDAARAHQHLPRLLGGIALDEPELGRIVGEHLAPFVVASTPARPLPTPLGTPVELGEPREHATVTAVVPIGQDWATIEVLLARLATDPEFREVEIVVVAGWTAARAHAARLADVVRFYGLGGRLVVAAETVDVGEAIDIGARVASGAMLLCMQPAVLPDGPGWLGRLVAELGREPARGLACPTLLYEDRSIRFAGDGGPSDPDGPPVTRWAGYPGHWLSDGPAVVTAHGPAECFVMPRQLFLELGGLTAGLIGPELRHLDLAARLRAAGRSCVWLPSVTMWALDDPTPVDEHWRKVARLVDRAAFARRWPAQTAIRKRAA